MRIRIRHGRLRLGLRLPVGWILNRISARIAAEAINGGRERDFVTTDSVLEFFGRVREIRREFKGLTIVEATMASGDYVVITL